jgi:KRAB domain-containing zinc finger protein
MQHPEIKQESSPSKSHPLIRTVNISEFNESANIKQECEIHIIDFAAVTKTKPKIYDEFSFDRIKSEPELNIIDHLEVENIDEGKNNSNLKVFEIYGNFQRLESSKWQENLMKKINERFFCEFCDKNFKNSHGLNKHVAAKHKDIKKAENLICDFCGKISSNKQKLFVHMRIHRIKAACKICGKFMIPAALKSHMTEIHGQHPKYKCPLCSKIYNSEKKFKQHTKTHVKKFECLICNRIFSASYRYKQHMMWHEDSNAFSCQICGKSFNRRGNLNEHLKVHNKAKVRNLKCEKCNFVTFYSKTLKYHLEKHKKQEKRDEKLKKSKTAVKCEICSLFYINSNALKNHMNNVHSKVKFKCDLCGIEIKVKGSVYKHMMKFHLK